MFGGPAWTRVVEPDGNPGQWYLHLFDAEQPDLNWEHPEVSDDFEKTLRFWLERGVDGFRIDVAHGMAKPAGLPDARGDSRVLHHDDDDPRFNHPSVHEIHRGIRSVVDDYPGAVTVGEVWVTDNDPLGGVSAARRTPSRLQLPVGADRFRRGRDSRRDPEFAGGDCD